MGRVRDRSRWWCWAVVLVLALPFAGCGGGGGGGDDGGDDGGGTNAAPTASFTATPASGAAPLGVHVDASASTDADGTVASYSWTFGDGSSATGVTADHTYTTAGSYTVTLTVTDDGAATDTATRTVTVSAASTATGGLVDATGAPISQVDLADPVTVNAEGLDPNTAYRIVVRDPSGNQLNPTGGFVATTDEDGNLPNLTVVQDLDVLDQVGQAAAGRVVARRLAQAGAYEIDVLDDAQNQVLTMDFTAADLSRVFTVDGAGVARGSFLPSEAVTAKVERGGGSLADGSYNVYVVSDLAAVLADGDAIGAPAAAVVVSGGTGTADLGTYAVGAYDLVVDVDGNGTFEAATDLISRRERFRAGFTVQTANSGGAIVGQVCADRNGNYRDVFDPNAAESSIRDMWAYITPSERSLVQHTIGVRKYVVAHRDVWTGGEVLVDVTAGIEVDPVQGYCTNEAPWLVWPRQLLTDGCYDVVIDVNRNGVFDAGTDFVDNIDNTGQTTCGCRVADSSCASNIQITSHQNGDVVNTTAITLEGTVAGSPVSGAVTITAGRQSNRVNLPIAAGTFSAVLPLFSGDNLLTVSFVYDTGAACSKTLAITSNASASATELFRVQLTWDGSTDMDLHLVRPGGSYANGGGGEDDCNYGNCQVGLDGSGTNSIDWGTPGEADDPKLDVDCIACGNGIENIWMNDIAQDGVYTIFIDAYSGAETNVTATVFIHGTQVGQVNCGDMASGTATDSCRVGTINWTGQNTGNGSFTPDGTKAADF